MLSSTIYPFQDLTSIAPRLKYRPAFELYLGKPALHTCSRAAVSKA